MILTPPHITSRHNADIQEPLLSSYMYSSILNHKTLEEAVAFHMATKLATPSLIGTHVQSLFMQCFEVSSKSSIPTCLTHTYFHDLLTY